MWQQMPFVLKSAAGVPSGTFDVNNDTHIHTDTHAHTYTRNSILVTFLKGFGSLSVSLIRFVQPMWTVL